MNSPLADSLRLIRPCSSRWTPNADENIGALPL
jgi:hypothetical protein